jgi:hypothetical protein
MMCVSEEGKAIIRKNYATRVEATCEFQMTQMLLGLTAGRQVGHSQHLGRHADLARAGIHDFRSVVVSSDNKYSGAQFIEAAITAAIEGDFKLVKRFVKGGVSPHARNKEGLTLLEAARDNAQSDIVDYLLSVIQERAQVSGS